MQKTIVLEHNGQKVISQPFTFRHACIMDDARYRGEGLATGARNAILKMFEGTVLTDEVIDNEIDIKQLKKAVEKTIDWFLGIDEEVKNS